MPEKLSSSLWTTFAKKKADLDLKDVDLVKALTAFEKTDLDKPEPRLDALKDVAEQVKKLMAALAKKKKELGDKPFAETNAKLKQLQALAEEAREEAEEAAAEAEEPDTPELLTTKMIPLVRQIKNGKGVELRTMICVAAKKASVLISRKPIPLTRRDILRTAAEASDGAKILTGTVLFEEGAFTFVVPKIIAGMAKKLRTALLRQVELRLKVRVRSPEGAEDDLEDEGDDGEGTQAKRPATKSAQKPEEQDAAPIGPDPGAAFKARMTALLPKIKQAGPEIKAMAQDAGALAAKKDFEGGHAVLDKIESLLEGFIADPEGLDPMAEFKARLAKVLPALKAAIESGRQGGAEQRQKVDEAVVAAKDREFEKAFFLLDDVEQWLKLGGEKGGMVAMQKSRLTWGNFRGNALKQLKELEKELLEQVEAHNKELETEGKEPEFEMEQVAKGAKSLYTILESLDERLIDTLDAALNVEGEARKALQKKAAQIIGEYEFFVASDKLLNAIDLNGFVKTTILTEANAALKQLKQLEEQL